ncbi:hypothetical protein [Bacillus cereus]|nr:hypothetical protein [Bacillus cereus]
MLNCCNYFLFIKLKIVFITHLFYGNEHEEFVDVIYEEIQYNTELFNLLSNTREQRLANEEYENLYFKDWNTTSPAYRPEDWHNVDWIEQLSKYKEKGLYL